MTCTNVSGTTNGQTITVNGVVRTWTNNVTSIQTQILTNNTIAGAASNMLAAYYVVPAPNATVAPVSTNAMLLKSFPGFPMVATVSAGWATVTLSTNTLTNATIVRVPLAVVGNYEATNVESGLVGYLNDNRMTSVISSSAPAFANYPSLIGTNTFTGTNSFTNSSFNNGTALNLVITNGQNFGNPFRSPGAGIGSEQFGLSASAGANFASAYGDSANAAALSSTAIGNLAVASGLYSVALGYGTSATNTRAIAIGYASSAFALQDMAVGANTLASGGSSTAIGYSANAAGLNALSLGEGTFCGYTNSTSIGAAALTTANHQVALGTSSENVWIPGGLQVDGSVSNMTFAGSATHNGAITANNELIVASFANSSLANGANSALNISTNAYVVVSGPTGSFTIAGIAGGVSGRVVTIQNGTGQSMVIANESGLDSTPANRIRTGFSADRTFTNNPATVSFRYDGGLSRWVETGNN